MLAAKRAAWLRSIAAPGIGPHTARPLLGHFGLPDRIFDPGPSTTARVVPEALAQSLSAAPSAQIQTLIDATEFWLPASPQHALVSLADTEYPPLLLDTRDPPPLLFAIGRRELLARSAIAVVGSCNATRQGVANAEAFAAAVARAGVTVVSGLALGIDAATHRGALDAGGRRRNHRGGRNWRRHRLSVGQSRHRRSREGRTGGRSRIAIGIVDHCAARDDTGRDVFAIPGSIHSPLSKSCHRLIREGAKLVESAQEILTELGVEQRPARPAVIATESAAELLQLIGHDPVDLDTLAQRRPRCCRPTQDIECLSGNRYQTLR